MRMITHPKELIGVQFRHNEGMYLITGYGYTLSDPTHMKITMVERMKQNIHLQTPADFWHCWHDKLPEIDCTALLQEQAFT